MLMAVTTRFYKSLITRRITFKPVLSLVYCAKPFQRKVSFEIRYKSSGSVPKMKIRPQDESPSPRSVPKMKIRPQDGQIRPQDEQILTQNPVPKMKTVPKMKIVPKMKSVPKMARYLIVSYSSV